MHWWMDVWWSLTFLASLTTALISRNSPTSHAPAFIVCNTASDESWGCDNLVSQARLNQPQRRLPSMSHTGKEGCGDLVGFHMQLR